MNEPLFKMIFYFEAGAMTEFDIIQWAMNQVIIGNESDSINRLASWTGSSRDEVIVLFKQAIKDLGLNYPSEQELGFYRAKLVSEEMLKGTILPVKGCSIIGRIGSDFEWPEILADFGVLNQELSNHIESGIIQEKLNEDIISLAINLIERVNKRLGLN